MQCTLLWCGCPFFIVVVFIIILRLSQVRFVSSRLASVRFYFLHFGSLTLDVPIHRVFSWQGALISLFIIELQMNLPLWYRGLIFWLVACMSLIMLLTFCLAAVIAITQRLVCRLQLCLSRGDRHCLPSTSSCIHLPFCLPTMY